MFAITAICSVRLRIACPCASMFACCNAAQFLNVSSVTDIVRRDLAFKFAAAQVDAPLPCTNYVAAMILFLFCDLSQTQQYMIR